MLSGLVNLKSSFSSIQKKIKSNRSSINLFVNNTLPTGNPAFWSSFVTEGERISEDLSNLSNISLSYKEIKVNWNFLIERKENLLPSILFVHSNIQVFHGFAMLLVFLI